MLLTTSVQLLAAVFGVSILLSAAPIHAAQTVPYKINFQGRLTDNSGNVLSDGLYNVKFRLFDALTVGTNKWEGDRIITATDNRIQVTNGLFNIQFGDTASGDPALSPALFASATFPLYLEVELPTPATASCATNACAVFTEGAMTPRQPLASTPYAFNADKLGGLDSTAFAQLGTSNTGSLTVTGALQGSTANFTGGAALTLGSTTNAATIALNDGTATARAVTLSVAPLTASYALILPTTGPSVSQCLLSGSTTASQLTFGSCSSGGATVSLSNLSGVAINTSLLPGINNTIDAGSTALNFRTGYFGTSVLTPNVDTPAAGTLLLGSATANAITLGKFGVTTSTSGNLVVNSGTNVPTTDQFTVDNTASTGVTTASADGIGVNFKGGAAAVEASGMRIDFAPGTTAGGTWSGLRIVANTIGATSGVSSYGLKLEGPTTPGNGTETGAYVGTGWDIGIDIQSGGIQLAAQANPTAPTAGNLKIYAKAVAGRVVPKWVGPSGVDTPFQAALWGNNTALWTTTGATAGVWQGTTGVGAGTYVTALPTITNLYTSMIRGLWASVVTTTNQQVGQRSSQNQFYRGSVAGQGGFFFFARFGTEAWTAGDRLFVGMGTGTTAMVTGNPSTLTNTLGFGIDAGDTAISFIHVDNAGVAIKDVIPGQPALAANQGYNAYIYAKPNDATVYYRLDNINTDTTIIDTSTTTALPANTAMMAAFALMSNGANKTVTSAEIGVNRMYIETDH